MAVIAGAGRQPRQAAAMLAIHNYKQTWSEAVSAYIALSDFARDKFIQGGLPARAKFFVKPNFFERPIPGIGAGVGTYQVLFAGRLTPEKGIRTLLEAWRENWGLSFLCKLPEDGPMAPEVERAAVFVALAKMAASRAEILRKMKDASGCWCCLRPGMRASR